MSCKKWFKRVLLLFLLVFTSIASINYIVDPYQIYHKNKFGYLPNERYQIAGLISSYLNSNDEDIDSIIVGTSMSQNFISKEVATELQFKKTLKLTISGSTPIMKDAVINYAIQTGKVKNILLDLFESYADSQSKDIQTLPLYLYESNEFIKFKNYILNIDTFKYSMLLLLNLQDTAKDLSDYQYWMSNAEMLFTKFNECSNLNSFNLVKKDFNYTYTDNLPQLDMLIKQIKENKNTDFLLFFPPYSRLFYYELDGDKLNRNISMRRYILENLDSAQNVKIYAFDNFSFTADLSNYKDKAHYNAQVSTKILQLISGDIGRITLENIDTYEDNFLQNLSSYIIYTSSNSCQKYKKVPHTINENLNQ